MSKLNHNELYHVQYELTLLGIIGPTSPFYWINISLIISSFIGFLVGCLWLLEYFFSLNLFGMVGRYQVIQAFILVVQPIFAILIAIEIMAIVVRTRVFRYLSQNNPQLKILERLLEGKRVSGLSATTNKAIEHYLSKYNEN